jgi:hypothetical protein
VRRRVGKSTGANEVAKLVRAGEDAVSIEVFEELVASRPVLQSHVALQSEHAQDDGDWAVRTCSLATDVPFDVRLPCPPDMVGLVGRMNGLHTVRELYDEFGRTGTLADDATIDRFASFIHLLVAHGLVELHKSATS